MGVTNLLIFVAVLSSSAIAPSQEVPGIVLPVMSPSLSSSYGPRIHPLRHYSVNHQGIDLAAPYGSWVRAVSSGRVVFADRFGGYGKMVTVLHRGVFSSHYAHLGDITVEPGQKVKAGAVIGHVGSSGLSTGPHLHFEWRYLGIALDPLSALPALRNRLTSAH